MTLVTSSIPNLINGVSQQPDPLRLASQAAVQVNARSSVVSGLGKRPPSKFKFVAATGSFANKTVLPHVINRDSSERYLILIAGTGVRVFDLRTGERVNVTYKDGARDYLECSNPSKDLRAVTVSDYTFILNRTRKVESSKETIAEYRPESLIWVRQGHYGSEYRINLNGTEVAFKTASRAATEAEWNAGSRYLGDDNNVTAAPTGYTATPPRELPEHLTPAFAATDYIAKKLLDLLRQNPTLASKFTFIRRGSLIRVRPNGVTTAAGTAYPDYTLTTTDSQGDTSLKAYKDSVQRFSDLPQYATSGFRIKVKGDDATEFDDYYVKYEGDITAGTWVEDIKDGERYKLDPVTMPHALIRQADGTFSLEALDWEPRKAGDKTSNPLPSFVGKKVRDLFFYRDRLGMVAQENVVMSRYGDYFNFFKASATQLLDTDPIDVSVTHTKVSDLNHAVSFNETLVLFGQHAQFQIAHPDLLTPKTVAFNQTTEFRCSPDVKPVGLGSYLYFAHGRGQQETVREYFVDRETAAKDAVDVTSHVPTFIPESLHHLTASETEDVLIGLTDGAPNRLYVYSSFWDGERKLQASWSYWEMDPMATILSASFVSSVLWLTVYRPDTDTITAESVDLSPGAFSTGLEFPILLDRQVTHNDVSIIFSETRNETTITLPYRATSDLVIVAQQGNPQTNSFTPGKRLSTGYVEGEQVEYRINGQGQIVVPGDLERFWIGLPYTMRYRFSKQYMRQSDGTGGAQTVVSGRLQLRKMAINFVGSGYFRVEVSREGRDPAVYPMTAKVLGSRGTEIGRLQLRDGSFRFPVMAQNTAADIEVINDSFLPSTFLSAEWVATYTERARRV